MTRLHTWLTLYGNQIEDGLWSIRSYDRVTVLLNIWAGPYVLTGKNYTIDIDFDGELKGDVDSIGDELSLMESEYSTLINRWRNRVQDQEFVLVNF